MVTKTSSGWSYAAWIASKADFSRLYTVCLVSTTVPQRRGLVPRGQRWATPEEYRELSV